MTFFKNIIKTTIVKIMGVFSSTRLGQFINEQIIYTDVKQDSYSGKIIDLNDDGTLLFECEKRGVVSLNSGEIAFHNSYTMRKHL